MNDVAPLRRSRRETKAMQARAFFAKLPRPLTKACWRIAELEEEVRFLKDKLKEKIARATEANPAGEPRMREAGERRMENGRT